MTSQDLQSDYCALWRQFAVDLCESFRKIAESTIPADDGKLHMLLKELYGVPYKEIRHALEEPKVEGTSDNIGPVTGLFFEQLVVAMAVPYIRHFVPDARFQRNQCSEPRVREIARDPDLYVVSHNRHVVVEIKAAPKKRDLERVIEIQQRYASVGIGYYLVGGYVAANPKLLQPFSGGWACFAECSVRNERHLASIPSFDRVMANAVSHLSNA